MEYRPVGSTGIKASIIGLGGEHLDNRPQEAVTEVISAAIDREINIMDMFMPGEAVRTHIGNALKGRREKMQIQGAIGSVDLNQQYDVSRDLAICKRYFEDMLRFLRTDYIDFGMLFLLDTHEDIDAILNNGIVDYARRLKQEGKVRVIGAGTHNPATARRIVEEGLAEMLMFSINPAFDMMPGNSDIMSMIGDDFAAGVTEVDPVRADLYRLCQSRGVGITVMKALGAGKLLSPDFTPFATPLTPVQCIHYALTRPAVASALIGCKSGEEVEAAVQYLDASDGEKGYSLAVSAFRDDGKGGFAGSCVYCNHCLPCPADIDIASANKYLDIAHLDEANIPPSIAQHYRSLAAHGSDCVKCGSCERRCPFSVQVMANMEKAAVLFGV